MTEQSSNNKPHNVESPCVRNCCLNEEDICLGCYRNIEEIMSWASSDDDKRLSILNECQRRKDDDHKQR